MIYFVSGYKANSTEVEALCKILLDAVPVDKQNSSL
jgi:7-keto-8-aminopelargonate synthetase-like enzyme